MSVTYRAQVVLGVEFDKSMIPRSFTHTLEKWVEYICSNNAKHKADGPHCRVCGSKTLINNRVEEVENDDFDTYDFEHALKADAPWGDTVLFTVGNSDDSEEELLLGLSLVEDDDIVESDRDLRPFEVTAQHWADVTDWLQRHDITTKPQLWLVSSCG